MRHRSTPRSWVLAALMCSLLPMTAAGQTADDGWTVPRTADGRPDLQGTWANNSATPLERPERLADKDSFTDEEVAELEAAASRLFGGGSDAGFADTVFNAAVANVEENVSRDGGTGNYSSVWMVDRNFDHRTALITNPRDGRLPPMTEAAKQRQADALAARQAHPYDGPRTCRCRSGASPTGSRASVGWGQATTATTRSFRPLTTWSC